MSIIEIDSLTHPGVEVFASLNEAQLLNRVESDNGLFIAESPKVIRVAINAGWEPVSLLCERRHIEGDAADIIALCGDDVPVYTGERGLLAALAGYTLTRGVLCAMRRRASVSVADVCKDERRVVVVDGVVDTTNIGAIFRSAAALGIDAVLLTRTSCDPLGPWTWLDGPISSLNDYGFRTAAMALKDNSVSIDDERLMNEERLAIVMGTEGDGLSDDVIQSADYVVRIPMAHGVDSLNVAAAAAVAFWQLRAR